MTNQMPSAHLPDAFAIHQRFETLDSGWRTFPHHYLLYASSGTFHLEVARAQWLLPPHRAALIGADVPIRISIRAPVTCASVIFASESLPPFDFDCRVFALSPLAREMIQYAMRWGSERIAPDAVAERFFLSLATVCAELALHPDHFWLPSAQSAELRRALAYTSERLADPLLCADVARIVGLSERTLARRCAQELGMPWRQFLRRARMIHGLELLAETDMPVLKVVYATGFESVSAFISAFRGFTGETPTAYRKRVCATS